MNYYLVTKISEAIETQKCMNLGKHCSQWKRPCTRDYPHAIPSTGTVQNWQISQSWEATGWLSRARLREWKQNVGDCWWWSVILGYSLPPKQILVMVAQPGEYTKTRQIVQRSWWFLWYVNYTSIKTTATKECPVCPCLVPAPAVKASFFSVTSQGALQPGSLFLFPPLPSHPLLASLFLTSK